jgi:hypothetical protein
MAKQKKFAVVGYHSDPYQIVVDEVVATTGGKAIKGVGDQVPDRQYGDYAALVAIELPEGVELKYS